MRTERDAVDFLMTRGLLSAAAVVDGEVSVHDVSARNTAFSVVSRDGRSFFVKFANGNAADQGVAREAALLAALRDRRAARHLPEVHCHAPDAGALVLGLVAPGRTLRDHHGHGRFSQRVARAQGRALAALHAEDPIPASAPHPYGLALHRPALGWLREMSEPNLTLVKRIQAAPALSGALDEIAAGWTMECPVHGDFKGANCMVVRDARGRGTAVTLVDWEHAGMGDPAWDAGSVLSEYLVSWLVSIPIVPIERPERLFELARSPLSRIRPAIGAFWDAYVAAAQLSPGEADRLLARAARYAGARLLQSAVEQSQVTPTLTGTTLCFAQVAENVVRRPLEAAVRLLGIPLRGAA